MAERPASRPVQTASSPGWPVTVEDLQHVVASHVPVFYLHPDERCASALLRCTCHTA